MNVTAFEADRSEDWAGLQALVSKSGGGAARLNSDEILRLGSLYRAAAADLAYSRRRFPRDPVTTRLESLVRTARAAVYGAEPRGWSVVEFAITGYWRRVAERPRMLAAAAFFLLVPMALGILWGLTDPDAAIGIVPGEFQGAVDPDTEQTLAADEGAAFSAEVLTNNIQVTLLAFALGITAGIGTAAIVAYNGVFIGVIMGVAIEDGNGVDLLTLITAHGVLELSCIVVGASAGLRMGWAIIEPGRLRRSRALAIEARKSLEIIIGTAFWLVVAGLAEGFLSRAVDFTGALVIGLGLGAIYWSLVVFRGVGVRGVGVRGARAASP